MLTKKMRTVLNEINIELIETIVASSSYSVYVKKILAVIGGICENPTQWGSGLNGVVSELLCRVVLNPKSRRTWLARAGAVDMYYNGARCECKTGSGNCDFLYNNERGYVLYTYYLNNSNGQRYIEPMLFEKAMFKSLLENGGYIKPQKNGLHIKGQSSKLYRDIMNAYDNGQCISIYDMIK